MSHKNITRRSKKQKKIGCGCNKSFRLWGGKRNRGGRRSKRSRKTVRGGGDGFVIAPTFPFSGGNDENTIPPNTINGGDGDPINPANVIDARQTNLF